MGKNLPPGVFLKHGRYYRVRADGKRRVWLPMTREREGLPALYMKLAELERAAVADDRMASLITDWQKSVMVRHAVKTQVNEIARCAVIAKAFAEFRAGQVQAPDASEFLQQFRDRPRTHNLYRALLRELMRYAIERGYRTDNPIAALRTMTEKARSRYITDSELRRIKVGGIYGDDGKRTRSGLMLAALIDMAYLTGQRISDLLALQWDRDPAKPDEPHVARDGLRFKPSKTRGSTGAAVLIEWTPRLRAVVDRLIAMRSARMLKARASQRVRSSHLFTTQAGSALTYSGASTAWKRAVKRAKVLDVHFHDLRAKALTDKERTDGMQAARTMGTHSTEAQTSDYVRARTGARTKATR